MVNELELLFPKLRPGSYRISSPKDKKYNCIAWAAGNALTWWWPSEDDRDTWPAGLVREETLVAFEMAFRSLAYLACADDSHEPEMEKIAIFALPPDRPSHGARQLPDGRWTSKLGESFDIEHELRDLEGDVYGKVVLIMGAG